ncbi:MAG TPA: quinone-dependent dihydroorotate dehydrogenase [Burkholderiales bacterium]|nr:quinone-dependent dihydroorotate dehydrogenase [Burkholderiales bacterium]
MIYRLARPLLFGLDPEHAHSLALGALDIRARFTGACPDPAIRCPRRIMGIDFPNPVGLAAGLDKNGDHIDALAALGFGFLEIGTVTPRPQPGNPRPRLFRLPQACALINRMGFNNQGVDHLVGRAMRACYRGVLGVNIGKNFDTPLEHAVDDYLVCLRKVYPVATYVTVNISSPNTTGLRQLQQAAELDALLAALKTEQRALAERHGRYVPLAVKIAPDLDDAQLAAIAAALARHAIDGVIATNTTVARPQVGGQRHADETGGLSGAPLHDMALNVVRKLRGRLGAGFPIIGVGGIISAEDARAMAAAGADLVQIYTGLIYRGPALVHAVATALCAAGSAR